MQVLEQQVRDLTAQLAQARKDTDIATVRDMLSRAGIRYVEESVDDMITLAATHRHEGHEIYLWFWANTGQLVSLSGGGEVTQ